MDTPEDKYSLSYFIYIGHQHSWAHGPSSIFKPRCIAFLKPISLHFFFFFPLLKGYCDYISPTWIICANLLISRLINNLIAFAIAIFLAVQARIFKSSWEYDEGIVFEDFILSVFCHFDSLQPGEL